MESTQAICTTVWKGLLSDFLQSSLSHPLVLMPYFILKAGLIIRPALWHPDWPAFTSNQQQMWEWCQGGPYAKGTFFPLIQEQTPSLSSKSPKQREGHLECSAAPCVWPRWMTDSSRHYKQGVVTACEHCTLQQLWKLAGRTTHAGGGGRTNEYRSSLRNAIVSDVFPTNMWKHFISFSH